MRIPAGSIEVDPARLSALVEMAQQLMRDQRLDEAQAAWSQVLAIAPEHPQALFHNGQYALYRRDIVGARRLFERAALADPHNPAIPLNLAFSHRAAGDTAGEMAALSQSLALDPYFFPALLAKGMLLERNGTPRKAAKIFADVLKIAPPDEHLSSELRRALKHARDAVSANSQLLDDFLGPRLDALRIADADLERFDECRAIAVGKKSAQIQIANYLLYPRLPAIPFYDPAQFAWLSLLENATDTIRGELEGALRVAERDFRPYVSHPDGSPLNQWAELNNSPRWSVLYLWKDGTKVAKNAALCPRTAALLESVELASIPGFAPTVFFSALEPHTRIPPHTGDTNARLIVHLPLIVPERCGFRVGNEIREWRLGKTLVFDDTIEHEAWNDSDKPRYVLILDIWNPFLSHAERTLVSELLAGLSDYYSGPA